MAIKSRKIGAYNGFNDAGMAQAAQSLSSLFGPAKATDYLAGVKARQIQQEMNFRQDLARVLENPNSPKDQRDRALLNNGLITPTTSYYKIDADNSRQIAERQMQEAGLTSRNTYTVDQNNAQKKYEFLNGDLNVAQDARVMVSPDRQRAMNIPAIVAGNVSLSPGERVYPGADPNAVPMDGQAKPKSETEVKGDILQRLPENQQVASVMAPAPVERVIGPDSRETFQYRNDAVGQQPAIPAVTPPDVVNLQTQRAALDQNAPDYQQRLGEINARITALNTKSGTTVNVNPGEKKFDETMGEADAKDIIGLGTGGEKAIRDKSTMLALRDQLRKTPGGFQNGIVSYASKFGVPIGDGASAVQVADSLISQIAPTQRVPGSGAQSNFELEQFKKALPGLMNTPTANEDIINLHVAMNDRSIKMAEIANLARLTDPKARITPQEVRDRIAALPDPLTEFNRAHGISSEGAGTPAPAPGGAPAPAPQGAPVSVTTPDEAERLAPGTIFQTPDGKTRVR